MKREEEIFDILDGTGIIYFGFPECPWCRNAVPVLLDAAEEVGIEKIYYIYIDNLLVISHHQIQFYFVMSIQRLKKLWLFFI